MIISLGNLRSGLDWWRSESKWGSDLMNGEYDEIFADRNLGILNGWWGKAVDRLGRWIAYRGRTKPNSKEEITARGATRLDRIAGVYATLTSTCSDEPCIADYSWEDVEPLYSLAFAVKPSPVFAGKMCHFLLPNIFIVMDNWATDTFDYEIYWRGMRDAWCRFDRKEAARKMLTDAIEPTHEIHLQYPVETKIVELCHIGQKHSRTYIKPRAGVHRA